ncbi:MAG TPA: Gfo/Idh/MocA family oxidoreductase [Candidatus Binataceae bacterium]|nr:Gfo/Idh/MocA family oxidoreductase [Candidatus Binataceae bacterium]
MLRGAISGFGEVAARAHLAGWRTRPDVQIVAIHDPVAARRHAAINLVKNLRVYDDLELMLDGERLDFVDIASPPAYHDVATRAALAAGANVLVEKPLCLERGTFAELRALAAKSRRVLMCVHNWKHAPAYRRAGELIAAGRLGAVGYVSLTRLRVGAAGFGGTAAGSGERWRLDERSGGGILIDHGWHIGYLAQYLMGGAQPLAVSAKLERATGGLVEEVADLRVEFPAGIAYCHLSWQAPVRRTSATIYGGDGLLEIEENRLTLTARSGVPEDHSVMDAPDESYHPSWFGAMAAEFERAIAEGPQGNTARNNLIEAEAALDLIVAARESASRGGAPISLAR